MVARVLREGLRLHGRKQDRLVVLLFFLLVVVMHWSHWVAHEQTLRCGWCHLVRVLVVRYRCRGHVAWVAVL